MAVASRFLRVGSASSSASSVGWLVVVGICVTLLFAVRSASSAGVLGEFRWIDPLQLLVAAVLVLASLRISTHQTMSRVAQLSGIVVAITSVAALIWSPSVHQLAQALTLCAVFVILGVLLSPSSHLDDTLSLDADLVSSATTAGIAGALRALHAASIIRDVEIRDHAQAVAVLASRLGTKIGMPPSEVQSLYWAALLHDVGKVGIERSILRKPGRLTHDEYLSVMRHASIGADLIRSIGPGPEYRAIAQMVLHHHERWDGRGYPAGRRSTDIPVGSRIIAITDAFEALLSDRTYRPAVGREEALKVITDGSGSHFDPDVVSIFLAMVTDNSETERIGSMIGSAVSVGPEKGNAEARGALVTSRTRWTAHYQL